MSTVEFDLLCAFEVHSRDDIRAILDAGFDIHQPIKGKSIANSLIESSTCCLTLEQGQMCGSKALPGVRASSGKGPVST
jgi:hypothetical protein